MTSTIKVQNIKHTNDTTAMTIATSGDITMNGKVFNANQPTFKLRGRTDTSYTPPINNSTAFQFAATEYATGGFTVSNTFSRVTVPVSGKYFLKTIIQHGSPGGGTETRYMGTNIRKNSAYIASQLDALVAVTDGWGAGNSYHTTQCETLIDLAANDYLEVVLGRSSSSDWSGVIYDDGTRGYTQFFGYLVG